jgi:hypothetical protein
VPADRYFQLAPEVRKTLEARVAGNALELARHGLPRRPFYLTGQAGGRTFSVHAEGERVILSQEGQERQEVELVQPVEPPQMPEPVAVEGTPTSGGPSDPAAEPSPGMSDLDAALEQLRKAWGQGGEA